MKSRQNYFTADWTLFKKRITSVFYLYVLTKCAPSCVAGARPLYFRASPLRFWKTVPTAESEAPEQRLSLILTTEQACLRREIWVPTAALLKAQTSGMRLRFARCVVSATSKHRGALVVSVKHLNTMWTGDADLRLCITTVEDGWRTSAVLNTRLVSTHYTI